MQHSPVVVLCREEKEAKEHCHGTACVGAYSRDGDSDGAAIIASNSHFIRDNGNSNASVVHVHGIKALWPCTTITWACTVVSEDPKNDLCLLAMRPNYRMP